MIFIHLPVYFEILATCFIPGEGVGGDWRFIGQASNRKECKRMVRAKEPTANGATFPAYYISKGGRGDCYAEFGMTGAGNRWQTCRF